MGALLGFFASPAKLQGLIIAAGVMIVLVLTLTIWALWEQSGRHKAETEAATMKAQAQVLAKSLEACNAGVAAAAKAGEAAITETQRLVRLAEKAFERNAALRKDIRSIVSRPAPVRADGKAKDCGDALAEIKVRTAGGRP